MACLLISAKPFTEPVMIYCQLDTLIKYHLKLKVFIKENAFEIVICKIGPFCLSLNVSAGTMMTKLGSVDVQHWQWGMLPGVRRYFDPNDILTPGSKYRNDILTPPYDILTSPIIINDKVLFAFYIYLIEYVI